MDELIEAFELEKVGKAGSKFDPDKARWFNHQYLMKKSDDELASLFMPILKEKGHNPSHEYVSEVCSLVKERVHLIHEIWDQAFFFFRPPQEYDQKMVKKKWKEHTPGLLNELKERLKNLDNFEADAIKETVKQLTGEKDVGMGQVMLPLRISLVGTGMGPDVAKIVEMLGKEESIRRIEKAVEEIA